MDVSIDVNEFYKLAREDIGKIIGVSAVNSAAIYNNTDKAITFYVYNYIDTVYWVAAQKTHIAPGTYGMVAASGSFFKILPNDNKNEEFLVSPNKAYVFSGPGNVQAL